MTCRYNEYADISKLIDDVNFSTTKHIKVKKMDTLNILKYDKKKLTSDNEKTLGLFRSVIVNNNGNIICVAPPKSIDFDNFSKNNKYEDCIFQKFEEGTTRILISTDVMSRGLDLDKISHVINFDVSAFPENYIHRIGRTYYDKCIL